MPMGGYCEACGRWVWITRTGRCQFGHAPGAVRDVQALEPYRSRGRLPDKDASSMPDVRRRDLWWWRHSLWIVWTLTLGFANWLAFVYIGLRARYRPWILWGFAYLLPLLITVAAIGTDYLAAAFSLQLFTSAVSFVHAMLVRPRYRALMLGAPPAAPPAPPFLWTPSDRPTLPTHLDAAVVEVIREAEARVDEITAAAQVIERPELRSRISQLCRTAEEILTELRKRPDQVPLARGFLVYYLDAAGRIVRGYARLTTASVDSPEVRHSLRQAEASLEGMQRAFDNQLAALMQQQLLDLETEIALLERTIEADNVLTLGPGEHTRPGERSELTPTAGTDRDADEKGTA